MKNASDKLSKQWKEQLLAYVQSENAYETHGLMTRWEDEEEENKAARAPMPEWPAELTAAALDAIRAANLQATAASADSIFAELRDQWPPAHAPLISMLQAGKGQTIPMVAWTGEDQLLVRVRDMHQADGYLLTLGRSTAQRDPKPGLPFFGVDASNTWFAQAMEQGVEIRKGWNSEQQALCPWPTGHEGLANPLGPVQWNGQYGLPNIIELLPFSDGQRVLLIGGNGTFVLSPTGAHRLQPDNMPEWWDAAAGEAGHYTFYASMSHAALSDDERWLACGDQDSTHKIFDTQNWQKVADIAPRSSYPHHARFSHDGKQVLLNSCHFYNGVSIAASVADFPLMTKDDEDPKVPSVHEWARVYASVATPNGWLLGDAYGMVHAISTSGELLWNLHLGSTIGSMALHPDGTRLAVTSAAGFVAVYALDQSAHAWQIGVRAPRELYRWLLWPDQAPMRW